MAQLWVFDSDILLPKRAADPGAPVAAEAWYNTTTNEFKYYNGTSIIVIGTGLSTEQVQDIVGAFFADSTHLDVTYDDAGNVISAVIKDGSVANVILANMAAATIKGRAAGAGTGAPVDLTAAQVKAILALASADISDFVANVRTSLGVTDTGTLDLTYNSGTGVLSGAVLDSPTVGGMSAAALQTAIIAAIVDSAPGTLDTLNELAAALGDDPNFVTTITALINARVRQYEANIGDGAATVIDVAHGLGTYDIQHSEWDVAGARGERHPGAEKPDNNTLRLTFNAAPAANSVRVVVQAK